MLKLLKSQKGFTLVELMIVVLIIAILVAIAIPLYQAVAFNAETKSCYSNQRTIEGAFQSYRADKDVAPATMDDLTGGANPYLKRNPRHPSDPSVSYSFNASGDVACPGGSKPHGNHP